MQGYKVKEKTAIAPPVSKLSGHPAAVVPHIDSRVKIIDNERLGASPNCILKYFENMMTDHSDSTIF
jgi:hypothetical protein